MNKTFKPTQPAKLAYKGAPLGVHDLIKQQIEFEDRFFPHYTEVHSEEVMKKELPTQKWTPAVKYVWGFNLIKSVLPL